MLTSRFRELFNIILDISFSLSIGDVIHSRFTLHKRESLYHKVNWKVKHTVFYANITQSIGSYDIRVLVLYNFQYLMYLSSSQSPVPTSPRSSLPFVVIYVEILSLMSLLVSSQAVYTYIVSTVYSQANYNWFMLESSETNHLLLWCGLYIDLPAST